MQRKVWEAIAKSWNERRQIAPKEVIEFSEDKNFILDIGCGSGRNFLKDKKYTCIDFSKEMLHLAKAHAKKKGAKAHLIQGSAINLPLKNNSFDNVLFVAVLHVIETDKERNQCLKELKRVMKKNGQALVTVWNKNQPRFKKRDKSIYLQWKVGDKKHMRYYYMFTEDELKDLLNKYFTVESIDGGKISGDRKNIVAVVKKI